LQQHGFLVLTLGLPASGAYEMFYNEYDDDEDDDSKTDASFNFISRMS